MKRRGFTVPGFKHREWEQEGKVYVYATNEVDLGDIEKTIDTIKEVISEFNLPLEVVNGNASMCKDALLVEDVISRNAQGGLIDCKNILTELRDYWGEGVLRYGLVALVNPERYEFRNEPSDPEPAIYGWTKDGLSVLRRFDIQKAVRHEFGHMVGLGFHHAGCAMDWNCSIHKFCKQCVKDINEIWELSDTSACGAGDSIKPGA